VAVFFLLTPIPQETNRGAVDEIVDERTRFEMYYPPFAGAAEG
jgi:hypothetical protein